jgi:tetratricopeptide (TPR) repeat protein
MPIFVSDLKPNITHRGRILRGKVITPSLATHSIQTIIEDEFQNVVKIALYNALPDNAPRTMNEAFLPIGQAVAIIEPLYQILPDGSSGILIGNPSEMIFEEVLSSKKSAQQLRKEGNDYFKEKEFEQAIRCYTAVLQQVDKNRVLSSFLCNNTAAHLKVVDQDPMVANIGLQHASAALLLDPSYDKARARLTTALEACGKGHLTKFCSTSSATPNLLITLGVSDALSDCMGVLSGHS